MKPLLNRRSQILILIFIAVLIAAGVFVSTHMGAASSIDESALKQTIEAHRISKGDLVFTGTQKNDAGDLLYYYTDETFKYVINTTNNTIVHGTANESIIAQWLENGDVGAIISKETAVQLALQSLARFFPEYSQDRMRVGEIIERDSHEHYLIELVEVKGNAHINEAWIGIGADGSIMSFRGSRFNEDVFDGAEKFTPQEMTEALYKTIMSKKTELEKTMNESVVNTRSEDDSIYAFPEYQIKVVSKADITVLEMYLVKLSVTESGIAWKIEFTYKTSWGEIDSMFNPNVIAWFDSQSGELVDFLYADGL